MKNEEETALLQLDRKTEKSKIPLLPFAAIMGVMLLAAVISVFIFWHGERARYQLLTAYQVPPEFLNDIFARGSGSVSEILSLNENVICAIGGYGNVDSLVLLNEKQRTSIPKANLPSEDLTWYLLFFSNDSVSRIYLMESATLGGNVGATGAGCVDREGRFVILKTPSANGGSQFVFNLTNKRSH